MSFLVLTIGGERLELNRVLRPAPRQNLSFGIFAAALFAGAILATFNLNWGARLSGLSMLALSLWFLKNDLATRNIRHPNPLTRYIAICLFSGFIWLGVSGIIYLYFGALIRRSAVRRGGACAVCRLRHLDDIRSRPDHLPRHPRSCQSRFTPLFMGSSSSSISRSSCASQVT